MKNLELPHNYNIIHFYKAFQIYNCKYNKLQLCKLI